MTRENLTRISRMITGAQNTDDESQGAEALSTFLFQYHSSPDRSNETHVSGGIALSSYDAAICVKEYLRTSRFIRGTYLAIRELMERFPGQQLNILYAGCGPFATILLPLLPLFDARDIRLTLLDINVHSIESVKGLIAKLGFDDHIREFVLGDAVTYRFPAGLPLHLVVSETMFQALIREPQVSITANLAPQITENGILVPQEIRTELVQTFHAKEPFFQNEAGIMNTVKNAGATPPRINMDTLFSMNRQHNFSDLLHDSSHFISKRYEVPAVMPESPDLCIFTSLTIFGDVKLGYAESSITNPYTVTALLNMQGHRHFRLIYDFRNIPAWSLELEKE